MISEKIAKAISYIFHPLLMPVFGLFMIFNSGTYLSSVPYEGQRLVYLIVFTGTCLVPLCFLPLFLYFKVVRTIEMNDPYQRNIPLLLTAMLYFFTFYIMHRFPIPFINMFILASFVCVLLNLIINFKWKISSHLIGAGGLTGLATALYIRLDADITLFLIGVIFIAGVTGFARLKLNAHTPKQVYVGFLLGFVSVALLMLL